MTKRSLQAQWKMLAHLTTATLAASLLLFGYPGVLRKDSGIPRHDDLAVPAPRGNLDTYPVELAFFRGATVLAPSYVEVDIAVDEEFIDRAGIRWETEVDETLAAANDLLAPVGLNVKTASIQRWRSDDTLRYISSHLKIAENQVLRAPGRLLLVLIGQDTGRYDGWIEESEARIIVQFYTEDPVRTHSLIAHEIGHLLGAEHHRDEDDCTEYGCVMDQEGYVHATTWCDYHREVIQEATAARLVAQGL